MLNLLENAGLALALAAGEDQDWWGAGGASALPPPCLGVPGPFPWAVGAVAERWGTWDGAAGQRLIPFTSHFDNCIIFQCVGGLFYHTIAWGGQEPNLLEGACFGPRAPSCCRSCR